MGFLSSIFGYVLNFLYELVSNYGIAIILFSILLRLILIPITIKQQKTMKKSAKIQGQMAEIQKKYKNNPEKLNQETIELYKKEKMSPFSGCLSAIVQLLIILSVFWLVSQPLNYMKNVKDLEIYKEYETKATENNSSYREIAIINLAETDYQEISKQLEDENVENREELQAKLEQIEQLRINMDFLGVDLSKVPTQSLSDWKVYIIPVLYVLTSFISIKLTTVQQNKKKKDIIVKAEGEEPDALDSMSQMNNSMMYMMPIMSISIAIIAPLGLALYWLVSNILMIVERLIINKIVDTMEERENEQ